MEVLIGKIYQVNHKRKGAFKIKVISIYDKYIDGIVIEGKVDAILKEDRKFKGEKVTINRKFCSFSEIK